MNVIDIERVLFYCHWCRKTKGLNLSSNSSKHVVRILKKCLPLSVPAFLWLYWVVNIPPTFTLHYLLGNDNVCIVNKSLYCFKALLFLLYNLHFHCVALKAISLRRAQWGRPMCSTHTVLGTLVLQRSHYKNKFFVFLQKINAILVDFWNPLGVCTQTFLLKTVVLKVH